MVAETLRLSTHSARSKDIISVQGFLTHPAFTIAYRHSGTERLTWEKSPLFVAGKPVKFLMLSVIGTHFCEIFRVHFNMVIS